MLNVFFAESKVSQDNVPLRIEQDILGLQVAVGRDEGRQMFVRGAMVRMFYVPLFTELHKVMKKY